MGDIMRVNPNRVRPNNPLPAEADWVATEQGTKWLGKTDKFLEELPKKIEFPVEGGKMVVTLIDDNCMETLWYVKWVNDEYAGGDVVIRRKDSIASSDAARALGYRNCVWISLKPDGRYSPSETGLRPFQNIGFDVYETF